MSYLIKEMFATLQGEGQNVGTPALFIRFSACNLWSGLDEDRQRDAERKGAKCPLFCDTDFRKGRSMTVSELVFEASLELERAGMYTPPLVVLTGGEPFLQIDQRLVQALRNRWGLDTVLAVETNGTVKPQAGVELDWICVSPKTEPGRIVVREGNELKVVVPAYDPKDYEALGEGFDHLFVSPEAQTLTVGRSLLRQDSTARAVKFCLQNPRWRLSLQTHKITGIP